MSFIIKEVLEWLGCLVYKICYYEKEGLFLYINRDQNGNCLFEEEYLEWMRVMFCFCVIGMKVFVLKQMVNFVMEGVLMILFRKVMFM